MSATNGESRRSLARLLAGVFVVALVLGPGPGSMWIDGSEAAPRFWFGIPALYAWLVLWFAVMAGCVVIAARRLWTDD